MKSVRFHTLLHILHLYKNSKNELLSTCGVVRSAQGAVSDLITAMRALHVIIYNDKQQSGRICRKLLFLLFAGQGKEFEVLQAIL